MKLYTEDIMILTETVQIVFTYFCPGTVKQ
jgi:hypothetical protein